MVQWRNGYATACKAAHTGSIPVCTSAEFMVVSLAWWNPEGPWPATLRPKHERLIRRPYFRYAGQGPS